MSVIALNATIDKYCEAVEELYLSGFHYKVCEIIEYLHPNASMALKMKILDRYEERNYNPFRTLRNEPFLV